MMVFRRNLITFLLVHRIIKHCVRLLFPFQRNCYCVLVLEERGYNEHYVIFSEPLFTSARFWHGSTDAPSPQQYGPVNKREDINGSHFSIVKYILCTYYVVLCMFLRREDQQCVTLLELYEGVQERKKTHQ